MGLLSVLCRSPPLLKRDIYVMLASKRGGKSKVVYDLRTSKWDPKRGRTKRPGLRKSLPPLYTPSGPADTTLVFESRCNTRAGRRAITLRTCDERFMTCSE